MNTIIFGAIVLGLISIIAAIATIVSLQIKEKRVDSVLAKHGLSEHKARQEKRAQEMSNNQDLFAK